MSRSYDVSTTVQEESHNVNFRVSQTEGELTTTIKTSGPVL